MKKFIAGLLSGIVLCGVVGAATLYEAQPATFKVMVNGKEFTSDPPALVVEGRTYLPLRAMGEALGVPINWTEELRQAEVGTTANLVKVSNLVQTNDKWKMTYLDCKTYKEINEYTKAAEGKEFVIVAFDVENISTEGQNFSFFWLGSYFDDYKTPVSILGEQIDGATMLGANTIEAGKKIKGYLAYEVEPEWKKIDIIYNESLLPDEEENKMSFTISR